jgi:hypothetical protein
MTILSTAGLEHLALAHIGFALLAFVPTQLILVPSPGVPFHFKVPIQR